MPQRRHPMMDQACDECKFRKNRCSRTRPACLLCQKKGILCTYSPRPSRSPLTREYVTLLENRIQALERLTRQSDPLYPEIRQPEERQPEINQPERSQPEIIQPALVPLQIIGSESSDSPTELPSQSSSVQQTSHSSATARLSSDASQPRTIAAMSPEALPDPVQGFDWMENDPAKLSTSNGMAALSVDTRSGGYLGQSSTAVLLRALQSSGWKVNDQIRSTNTDFLIGSTVTHSIGVLSQLSSSRQVEAILLNAYFQFYHPSYPLIHEPTFRAQHNGLLARPGEAIWNLLLNAILAIGAWSLGQDDSVIPNPFYMEAQRLLRSTSVFECGNLCLVQALTLLGNYVQKQNRPNTGWNYLGLASRVAISLAMHKELPGWNASVLQKEMRRRTWWCLYIFDSGASITFGRPILMPHINTTDVRNILNVHDADLTAASTEYPPSADEPTLYSVLLAQSKLHQTINDIHNQLISSQRLSAEKAQEFDMAIEAWYARLPNYIHNPGQFALGDVVMPSARRLLWRYYNFRMLMFRPFVVQWALRQTSSQREPVAGLERGYDEDRCQQLCLQNAHLTIVSIQKQATHATPIETWYAVYFLFQAALIPSIFFCVDPHSPAASTWLEDVNTARHLLSEFATRNKVADQCHTVINDLADMMTTVTGDNFDDERQSSMLNNLCQQFAPSIDDYSGDWGFT